MPPNSEKVYDRKAAGEFWGGAFTQMGLKDAVLETVEVFGSGDTITEVDNYILKVEPEGQVFRRLETDGGRLENAQGHLEQRSHAALTI